MMKAAAISIILCAALPILFTAVRAAEFRNLSPILAPANVPEGTRPVQVIRPVSPAIVENTIKELMASWNTPLLRQHLSDRFYDRQRLLDVINTFAPRDARIHVLGIQSTQTLQQYIEEGENGRPTLVSRVAVSVITQVEFTDPSLGFETLDGTNQYILNIRQQVMNSNEGA
jgi:hypothetical protein